MTIFRSTIVLLKMGIDKNQLDATKCWFIVSTCFEDQYAHLQEYSSTPEDGHTNAQNMLRQ
jgi:hypothetical protein